MIKKQRVFPRYVLNNSAFEEMDFFCFKYLLDRKILTEQIKKSKDQIKKIKNLKKQCSKEDIQRFTVEAKNMIELYCIALKQYDEKNKFQELNIPSDFLDILKINPYPWDFSGKNNLRALWKSKQSIQGR